MNVDQSLLKEAISGVQNSDWNRALEYSSRLLEIKPNEPDFLHIYAIAQTNKGLHDVAEEAVQKAIKINSKEPSYHNTLGMIWKTKFRYLEALKEFEIAAKLAPQIASYHAHIGMMLYILREFTQALPILEKAIYLSPTFSIPYLHLGLCYEGIGSNESALKYLIKAAELAPNNDAINSDLLSYLLRNHNFGLAIEIAKDLVKRMPYSEKLFSLLAEAYYLDGDHENAVAIYNEAAEKFPENVFFKIQKILLFPHIPTSNDEIDQVRKKFFNDVEQLLLEKPNLEKPEQNEFKFPFYHNYYGRDDKILRLKLAELFSTVSPTLNYISPHCIDYKKPSRPIKIAFIDNFFFKNQAGKLYEKLIEIFSRNPAYEVFFLTFINKKSSFLQKIAEHCRLLVLPSDLSAAREVVSALKLDIILYTEISLSFTTYLLAFARLAPVQAVFAGGHPMTSGIGSIDYALSYRDFESQNSQEHYSEKLILMACVPEIISRPILPSVIKSRQELGLPEGKLYGLPIMAFRIHPDMDEVFFKILERDDAAKIVLLANPGKWKILLEKRFTKTIPEPYRSRIFIRDLAESEIFDHVVLNFDVVLDPFYFSMRTTLFSIFAANIPVVTLQGKFLRGLGTAGCYKKMGIEEMIAKTSEEYVDLAYKIANNVDFKQKISDKIRAANSVLYDNISIAESLAKFIEEVVPQPSP